MEGNASVKRSHILLYATIALAMFLDGLDGTIVTVALPAMAESFNIGTSESSWIVTIYFLMMAGLILIIGKICDRGAIKKILLLGFAIFSLSSLACGLSPSITTLLIFRAVQGVGAAMLAAAGVMLSVKFLPPQKIAFGLALGVLGSSLGAAFGPVLGGVLTEYISWSWIFFINVPIGLVAIFIANKALPSDKPMVSEPFDFVGSVLLFISLVTGLYTLESFPSHGLTDLSLVTLVTFVVLFSIFIVYELKIQNPVLKLRLFKSKRFDYIIIAFALMNACFMGSLYLLPFYFKIEMGYSTLISGLLLLIQAAVTLLLCVKVGKLCEIYGARKFVLISLVSFSAFCAVFSVINASYGLIPIIFGLVLLGLVWGLAGGTIGTRVIENVPVEDKGSGSSLLSFFIYFGSALGTALYSGLFNLGANAGGISISDLQPDVFMNGFSFTMFVGLILVLIALYLSWAVKDDNHN